MAVPEASGAGLGRLDVPFHEDGASYRALGSENQVLLSTSPTSPTRPTRSMGLGLLASEKKAPDVASWDHVSPTILVPGGIVTVEVRIYIPASTKRIPPMLASRARWNAAVSSVTPSPLQPRSLVYKKAEEGMSLY